MTKTQREALKDIHTGRDMTLSTRTGKTIASLHEAGAIRPNADGWELTEYGTALIEGR